jgi:hypothetical protein
MANVSPTAGPDETDNDDDTFVVPRIRNRLQNKISLSVDYCVKIIGTRRHW